jgi:hypothetical protein
MKHTAQTLPAPRLVRVLGADPRFACNDEDDFTYRGPLTMPSELTEQEWQEADLAEDAGKAQRRADMELARAKEAQINTPEVWRMNGVL